MTPRAAVLLICNIIAGAALLLPPGNITLIGFAAMTVMLVYIGEANAADQ